MCPIDLFGPVANGRALERLHERSVLLASVLQAAMENARWPRPTRSHCKPGNWRAPATLPTDICEAGTFCDIDCAGGYANFDEAKGCANAGKGYCCKDTKPAKYPFTPNTK